MLGTIKDGAELSPETAVVYANACGKQLEEQFDLTLDPDDSASLVDIDEFVLTVMRTETDRESEQTGYVPVSAMIALGCLAGRIMSHAAKRELQLETRWIQDTAISGTGVALAISKGDEQLAVVNPIGKAIKLFQSGAGDSIAFLYQSIRGVAVGNTPGS